MFLTFMFDEYFCHMIHSLHELTFWCSKTHIPNYVNGAFKHAQNNNGKERKEKEIKKEMNIDDSPTWICAS